MKTQINALKFMIMDTVLQEFHQLYVDQEAKKKLLLVLKNKS